ncbi:MAG: cytochrome P450 [Geminicoccaceae bacterium]
MTRAPHFEIDMAALSRDPYPIFAAMRRDAPIAYVPALDGVMLTRRDDVVAAERHIELFSSHQPAGLMNRLMGQNLMRKDGEAHKAERRAIYPALSPKAVSASWEAIFEQAADHLLDRMEPKGKADLVADYALPLSAEALKAITGLTNITYQEMDAWSQAMIDGIANYGGDPEVEARCHAATAAIDSAIDDMTPLAQKRPDRSLLSVMLEAGMPMDSLRANIKLAISGGQNEPRDAIAGAAWALIAHPDQLTLAQTGKASWMQVFDEYVRWLSPIGMSPRRVAAGADFLGISFEPETRIFLMFSSANRDEAHFAEPARFDITRDTSGSIAFGAGPHICAGVFTAKTLVGKVALPRLFERLPGLRLDPQSPVTFSGWAFRGPLALRVLWDPV